VGDARKEYKGTTPTTVRGAQRYNIQFVPGGTIAGSFRPESGRGSRDEGGGADNTDKESLRGNLQSPYAFGLRQSRCGVLYSSRDRQRVMITKKFKSEDAKPLTKRIIRYTSEGENGYFRQQITGKKARRRGYLPELPEHAGALNARKGKLHMPGRDRSLLLRCGGETRG